VVFDEMLADYVIVYFAKDCYVKYCVNLPGNVFKRKEFSGLLKTLQPSFRQICAGQGIYLPPGLFPIYVHGTPDSCYTGRILCFDDIIVFYILLTVHPEEIVGF
jgi:hypothetical protein